MLSNLLATVAEGGKILLEEDNYLLARVQIDGRAMLAEISSGSSGGFSSGDWPEIDNVLLPDSLIHPGNDTETRILLFSLPDNAELCIESIVRDGGFSEVLALETGKKVLDILRMVHNDGYRVGYLGPESILRTDRGKHLILGGARGIPDTPFSPPEAVGRTPDDPRSDIYALGLLIFRLIAGSDNRNIQIEAWNRLSRRVLKLLENMVSPEPDNRFPNLIALEGRLKRIEPETGTKTTERVREHPRNTGRKVFFSILAAVTITLIILVLLKFRPDASLELNGIESDSASLIQEIDSIGIDQDLPLEETVIPLNDTLPEPVVWISNSSGQSGRASEFRQGPASEYSTVYTSTGSQRRSSLLLARRDDPYLPLENQERIYSIAEELAAHDSAITITPVDMTLLLGADIIDDSIMPGIVVPVSDPAGTLYIDIANHGLEGVYANVGAATWVRSVLHGRSIVLDSEEWQMTVVDFRNGDRLNAELGIPAALDSTLFLYRNRIPLLAAAEDQLRNLFLDSTPDDHPAVTLPAPPDIWIFLAE
ncbi:MAG: hypothetical protein ABFR50_03105 [Candidatus Fermentibacteria bacterium]